MTGLVAFIMDDWFSIVNTLLEDLRSLSSIIAGGAG